MGETTKVLVFGYGNPGRLDDGLGPALSSAIEAQGLEAVTTDSDYQLNIEDATAFQEHDVVVFADADVRQVAPFHFTRIKPAFDVEYTSHSVEPEALFGLAVKLFGCREDFPCYVLGIQGYEFNDFGNWMSDGAQENLVAAVDFILNVVKSRKFEQAAALNSLEMRNKLPQ